MSNPLVPGRTRTHDPEGTSNAIPTVVIVDDDADIRELNRHRLTRSGLFDVVGEAAHGREGIAVVAAERPAMVLLDVNMPVMDGIEALPRLRTISPGSVIVMHSSLPYDHLVHTIGTPGPDAFFPKEGRFSAIPARLQAIWTAGSTPRA